MALRLAAAGSRSHDRGNVVLWRFEPGACFAMPDAVDGEVGCQHERGEPRLERLLDHLVTDAPVSKDIDLEPARRTRGCRVRSRPESRSQRSRRT